MVNKHKIINDPVYGFITIPTELIFDLMEHAWFQRLSRIKQLGLTYLVYPGAQHSRLSHALGAMHLMGQSLEVLKAKGLEISAEEVEAVTIAILLHDIGHGPFSHTLEKLILPIWSHEEISLLLTEELNKQFGGKLSLALQIFRDKYEKKFLHQLVSSQLDMDRLDYLNRDSFFTGVAEGVIGYDRIIKMLAVHNNELVVEEKGIYSVEKFLVSRRLMYWQVYLHKTVLAAEEMLVQIMSRAARLSKQSGIEAAPALAQFFEWNKSGLPVDFAVILQKFTELDDTDIIGSLKIWAKHDDFVLSFLCRSLLSRKLFGIKLQNNPFSETMIASLKDSIVKARLMNEEAAYYCVFTDSTSNHAYSPSSGQINILFKNGTLKDIATASDLLNIAVLREPVVKYYLCYPKFD